LELRLSRKSEKKQMGETMKLEDSRELTSVVLAGSEAAVLWNPWSRNAIAREQV
jgi:D-hexose-6-phosphate mutarotase